MSWEVLPCEVVGGVVVVWGVVVGVVEVVVGVVDVGCADGVVEGVVVVGMVDAGVGVVTPPDWGTDKIWRTWSWGFRSSSN